MKRHSASEDRTPYCASFRIVDATQQQLHGGFTLVELLVTITIIGVLASLLLPGIQAARESARRSLCHSQQRELAFALLNFSDTRGYLPGTGAPHTVDGTTLENSSGDVIFITDRRGDPLGSNPGVGAARGAIQHASIFVQLLPYLERDDLLNLDSLAAHQQVELPVFYCPSTHDGRVAGHCDYAWNAGFRDFTDSGELEPPDRTRNWRSDGIARLNFFVQDDVLRSQGNGWPLAEIENGDGSSNTVALTERARLPGNNDFYYHGYPSTDAVGRPFRVTSVFSSFDGPPMSPREQDRLERETPEGQTAYTTRAGGNHSGGGLVSFMDGAVKHISFEVDGRVWKSMCGISDGKRLSSTDCGPVNLETDPPEFMTPCPEP